MLKKIMLSMISALALTTFPCQAEEGAVYGPFTSFDTQAYSDNPFRQEDHALSFRFAGEKEDGALSFFVAKDSFSKQESDAFASDLNAISPAAGIHFTMDFSL